MIGRDRGRGAGAEGWQAVAAANGIENPRRLEPGTFVDLKCRHPPHRSRHRGPDVSVIINELEVVATPEPPPPARRTRRRAPPRGRRPPRSTCVRVIRHLAEPRRPREGRLMTLPTQRALHRAGPSFELDGSESAELTDRVLSLVVTETTEGLARCELVVGNWSGDGPSTATCSTDAACVDFGSELAVRLGDGDRAGSVFAGAVTGIEAHYPAGAARPRSCSSPRTGSRTCG